MGNGMHAIRETNKQALRELAQVQVTLSAISRDNGKRFEVLTEKLAGNKETNAYYKMFSGIGTGALGITAACGDEGSAWRSSFETASKVLPQISGMAESFKEADSTRLDGQKAHAQRDWSHIDGQEKLATDAFARLVEATRQIGQEDSALFRFRSS